MYAAAPTPAPKTISDPIIILKEAVDSAATAAAMEVKMPAPIIFLAITSFLAAELISSLKPGKSPVLMVVSILVLQVPVAVDLHTPNCNKRGAPSW